MSKHPETDAERALWRIDDDPYSSMAAFAEKMEEQRNEAEAALLAIDSTQPYAISIIDDEVIEMNEWRKKHAAAIERARSRKAGRER